MSKQELDIWGTIICENHDNITVDISSNQFVWITNKVNPDIISAYRQCLELNVLGLKSKTTLHDENIMILQLSSASTPGTINRITQIPEDSWTCEGPLRDIQGRMDALTNDSFALTCSRNIAQTPFDFVGRYMYARASSIVIMTSMGTITRSVEPIFQDPPQSLIYATAEFPQLVDMINKLREKIAELISRLNSL